VIMFTEIKLCFATGSATVFEQHWLKSRTRIFSKSRSDFNFVFIVILFKNVIRLIITEQSLLLVTSREQKKMIFNFDF